MQSSRLRNFISLCGKVAYLVDEWKRVNVGFGGFRKAFGVVFLHKMPSTQWPGTQHDGHATC